MKEKFIKVFQYHEGNGREIFVNTKYIVSISAADGFTTIETTNGLIEFIKDSPAAVYSKINDCE